MKPKVLVLCHDTIGEKMAGPGIRYRNVAEQLSEIADVTLSVFTDSEKTPFKSGIKPVAKHGESYKEIFDKYDVIFAQWLSGEMFRYAKDSAKMIIIDLYAPVPIEYLASLEFSGKPISSRDDIEFAGILETYSQYLSGGDFFVCSNERQRDFWVGLATAMGVLRPTNFSQTDLLQRLAICPMGIEATPPKTTKLMLRSSLNLNPDDFVLLWTGGIWDWFDAKLVIRAVAKLRDPKIKLVFLGTKHPNSIYKKEMRESLATRQLADELDLTNKRVFFLDGWVPYGERAAYFLDADAAIYADKESLETRYSHRTRVLDHIWTELPTICNSGDYMAEVIERYGFGIVVAKRNDKEFAAAIDKLANDKKLQAKIRANIRSQKKLFTWGATLSPLKEYVAKLQDQPKSIIRSDIPLAGIPQSRLRSRFKRAAKILIKGQ